MDFRKELAKWGYNKGNSIDVETLVDEILPSLFSQQERKYSKEDMSEAFEWGAEHITFEDWMIKYKKK